LVVDLSIHGAKLHPPHKDRSIDYQAQKGSHKRFGRKKQKIKQYKEKSLQQNNKKKQK